MSQHELDLNSAYKVDGYGIALYVVGYVERDTADTDWDGIKEIDQGFVRAVMVGDDREHIIDVDDLEPIDANDYCGGCGQIGCGCYGYN
jgi:hypothetical protein